MWITSTSFCYTSLFLHCHWTDLRKGLCWELWAELLQIMLKYSAKLWICLLAMEAYFSHGIKKVCDFFFTIQITFFFLLRIVNLHLAILFFLLLLLQNSEEFAQSGEKSQNCKVRIPRKVFLRPGGYKLAIVQFWLCSSELWVYILQLWPFCP